MEFFKSKRVEYLQKQKKEGGGRMICVKHGLGQLIRGLVAFKIPPSPPALYPISDPLTLNTKRRSSIAKLHRFCVRLFLLKDEFQKSNFYHT